MTSKNSFFNILLIALRDRLWGAALTIIGFFFAFPVYSAMCAGITRDRVSGLNLESGVEKAIFARDALGENNVLLTFVVVILGIFLAFNGFSYLYSKSKVDLYHSIPLKRQGIFITEYLAGVITYIVPYIIFMLLAFVVGAVNGMLDFRGVYSALIMMAINLLGFLAVYNTSILAIVLTGNIAVGIMASAVFFLYGILVDLLFIEYKTDFFITESDYAGDFILEHASPIIAFVRLKDGMGSFRGQYNLKPVNFVIFIAFVLISFALSFVAFKKRSSEASGKSIAFKKLMPVISVFLLVPVALFGGLTFEEFAGNGLRIFYGWYIFGFLATLVLGHFVIQAIYYLDFKSLCKNLINPAIAGLCAAIIALIYMFDLTGFDSYVPKADSIESAAVSSYAMQGTIEYYKFGEADDEFGGYNYGIDQMEYRLENMNIVDKELIRDIAAVGVSDSKILSDLYKLNGNDEEYYEYTDHFASVTVKYKLRSGREIYRCYNINLLEHMDLYERLYANNEYKEIVCPMLTLDEEEATDLCYASQFGDEITAFSKEDVSALLKAYKADVQEQKVSSLKDEVPYGFLYQAVRIRENNYTSVYTTNKAYIYPSFRRTLAILEKYGVDLNYHKDISNVSSIVVTNYNVTDDMGQSSRSEYTEEEDIRAILEKSYPGDLINVERVLATVEPIDITVNLKTSSYGYAVGVYYCIRRGEVPDFVAKDINLSKIN